MAVVALPPPEMPLGSRESWRTAPALAVFPATMWTPALHKTSLSRSAAWDPVLRPPRALTLHHSLSLWVCLLLMEEAGDEQEAQDPGVLPARPMRSSARKGISITCTSPALPGADPRLVMEGVWHLPQPGCPITSCSTTQIKQFPLDSC